MSPDAERWERINTILADALDLEESKRASFIEERCGDDPELKAEVESLLAAALEVDDYFDDLAGRAGITLSLLDDEALADSLDSVGESGTSGDTGPEAWVGRRLGQYRILEVLGRGGMAWVYLAEREGEGFVQRVALKLVARKVSDPLVLRRSGDERRILARLEHRSIARLIDGGISPEGQPFYAMEYVDGVDVLTYCDRHRLTVRERLRLFLELCEPVQFAHERLIIHCDLKPNNVYVTDDGHVKLLDFGIARVMDPNQSGDEETGLWFTPSYASPEQVRRETAGTASDVYSLGVLLYEILTGHKPYRFERRATDEIRRVVCEVVPESPAEVVLRPAERTVDGERIEVSPERIAADRSTHPDRLRRKLRGDLEAIVGRALEKDPDHRYRTAAQLGNEIRRYLRGEGVEASEATLGYRTKKFILRNRRTVIAASLVGLAVLVGLAGTVWQAQRATQAAQEATEEAERAELVASLMLDIFRLSDPVETVGDTISAREVLDRGSERIRSELTDQPEVQARLLGEVADVYVNLGNLTRAEALSREVLALREELFGPESLEVSESLVQLGEVEALGGELIASIASFERAIEIREPQVVFPDTVLIRAQGGLAWSLRDRQEFERAAELFNQALEGERALGREGGVAEAMMGLAATFHDAGRFDEADELFRTFIGDSLGAHEPSPLIVMSLTNVGMIRRLRGQFEEAEPLLRAATEMGVSLFGPEHSSVFDAQVEWGAALGGLGRFAEAERILRDGIASATVALGPEHNATAQFQEILGSILYQTEAFDEAFEMYAASAAEKIRRHGGNDHPGIVASFSFAALSLAEAGRIEEAREYVNRATVMNARIGDIEESVYTILNRQSLARVAVVEGNDAEAEELYQVAMASAERLLSPNHRYTLGVMEDYGRFLAERGSVDAARAMFERTLEGRSETIGATHPLTRRIRDRLAALGS